MEKMHRYIMRSVKKACPLVVLLVDIVISHRFNEKGALQRLAEWLDLGGPYPYIFHWLRSTLSPCIFWFYYQALHIPI